MKTWIMVRHAKSSWAIDVPDRERPISDRGVRDATLVGKELNKYKLNIEQVFSSPAKRTFDTSLLMVAELGLSIEEIQIEEKLYDFHGSQVLDFVSKLPDKLNTVMSFGHNYSCTYIAQMLGNFSKSNIPTATAVIFRFDVSSWSKVEQCDCTVICPKSLR
ncbi:MAG: histidine phosphatase family protein [Bacteroidota bacterium]|nr:histidine phosphatase family protein [Bacteroidota bacterium]